MTDSLIEKLEAALIKEPDIQGMFVNSGIRDAIAIIRQHEAESAMYKESYSDLVNGRTSEISVVCEAGLRQQIEVALALGNAGKVEAVEAVMRVIRPCLRATKPVSLALCAKAIEAGYVQNRFGATEYAKAVLDAAGVKYHEN